MTEQANKKVLILGEYPRLDHYKNDVYDYFNTQMGRTLKAVVKEYAGITAKDFTYLNTCKFVPDVLQERRGKVIKYKEPTITEMQKGRAVLDEEGNIQKDENGEEVRKGSSYIQTTKEILELKPDIVIPTGKLGVKLLLDISSITKARGVPVKTTLEYEGDSHTFWVLPTLSIEYVTVRPNLERQVASDFMTLSKYLKQGDKAFEAGDVKYELVTNIERVREIFNNDIKQQYDDYKIVAWDTETNTLQPDKEGSKILVLTMTWKFGQGVTIPIHKADFEWPNGEQDVQEIMQLWKEWLADKSQQKVAHNCNYDENVLRHVAGFTDIESVQDTKVGWYLAVSQESAESLRLSDLAYEVTDMGGYDTPLESFKKWYKGDLLKYLEKEIKEKVKENKKLAKKVHGIKATEYKQWLEDNIDTTKSYTDVSNQFIALDLLPETVTKTSLISSESFKAIVEKSPEYMSLSDDSKAYVLDNALEQINTNKEASKVRNQVDDSTFDYDWIPLELMHPYASGDTDCCRRIYTNVRERLKDKPKLEYLLTTSYPRLERTLTKMQYNGLHLDVDYAVENDKVYEEKLKEVEESITNHWSAQEVISEKSYLYQLGVEEFAKPPAERDKVLANYKTKYKPEKQIFNPGSIDDKAKLLFEVLGMELPYNREFIKKSALDANKPEDKITTKDYKTDKKVIAHLAKSYPEHKDIMDLLLAYSDYSTVRSTFTSGFLERYNKNTSKLHGTYNSAGTETGRLSSRAPNLQNLPRKSTNVKEFGYKHPVKRTFTSSFENGALIQADYSALEMRIIALFTKDEGLTQAFLDGEDVHKATASIVFGKPMDEVTDEERTKSKAVNFGLAYGETPQSFSAKNDMTVEEAESIFEQYYRTKPQVKQAIDDVHQQAIRVGYVETMHGHRRILKGAQSRDNQIKNRALRQSFNAIIQGTGAYLTNMALTFIDDFLTKHNYKSKLILTVHDSIVVDSPEDEVLEVSKAVKYIMENLPYDFLFIERNGERMRFPVTADAEIGASYNDMVDLHPEDYNTFNSVKGYLKFYGDLAKLKYTKDSKVITKEQYDTLVEKVESQKDLYRNI